MLRALAAVVLALNLTLFAAPEISQAEDRLPAPGVAADAIDLFAEKDAFVGFLGDPVHPAGPLGPVVNGSVPATLFEWLTGREVNPGQDGWGYSSLARELGLGR
jgi:hypothetical protein